VYSITISNVVYCYQTKFHTDVTAAPIKKACVAMMKKAIRQQRYKLKKRYFNAFATTYGAQKISCDLND